MNSDDRPNDALARDAATFFLFPRVCRLNGKMIAVFTWTPYSTTQVQTAQISHKSYIYIYVHFSEECGIDAHRSYIWDVEGLLMIRHDLNVLHTYNECMWLMPRKDTQKSRLCEAQANLSLN